MTSLAKGDRVALLADDCRVEQGSLGTVTGLLPQRPDLACVRWDDGVELIYERRVLAKVGVA